MHRVDVELSFTPPLFPDNLFGHLAATAVPGVEEWRDGAYRCTLRLPHGPAVASLRPPNQSGPNQSGSNESGPGGAYPATIRARLYLSHPADVAAAVAICRRLLDLDADPLAIDARLRQDPVLAPLVHAAPGRRVPGTAHRDEFALRAVLGQQVSTAAARTHAARIVRACGEPVDDPEGGLTHLFPRPAVLADLDPALLAMPAARRETVLRLARALADGTVDLAGDPTRSTARAALAAVRGIGPWTVETVAMRALGDGDAFVATDLGVRLAAERLGLSTAPAALTARSREWSPWRAYAVQHLWATGAHPVNHLPE